MRVLSRQLSPGLKAYLRAQALSPGKALASEGDLYRIGRLLARSKKHGRTAEEILGLKRSWRLAVPGALTVDNFISYLAVAGRSRQRLDKGLLETMLTACQTPGLVKQFFSLIFSEKGAVPKLAKMKLHGGPHLEKVLCRVILAIHGLRRESGALQSRRASRAVEELYRLAINEDKSATALVVAMHQFLAQHNYWLSVTQLGEIPEVKAMTWRCAAELLSSIAELERKLLRSVYRQFLKQLPKIEVDWQILTSSSGSAAPILGQNLSGLNKTSKDVLVLRRLEGLAILDESQALRIWQGQVLKGRGKYIAYEYPGGVIAEATSVEQSGHAIYLCQKEEGDTAKGSSFLDSSLTGQQPSWQLVLVSTKAEARERGAERIFHTPGWQDQLRQAINSFS